MSSKHISSQRVFPSKRPNEPRHSYLSILDSSVANYTTCGAIFVFPFFPGPHSSGTSPPPAYTAEALTSSLKKVLDVYPQWSGSLRLVDYDPDLACTDHRRRFGRVELLWGRQDDPGVGISFYSRSGPLSSIYPQKVYEQTGVKDGKTADRDLFVPSSSLVKLRSPSSPTPPAMAIRITTFSDGIAISVGMHHSLGDATTLMTFMKDWSAIHRSLLASTSTATIPTRPFEPQKLDDYASGDVDDSKEDESILAKAMQIPQLRYDFWASNEGRPPIISTPGYPDPLIAPLDLASGSKRGVPIPWNSWDWQAPVVDYLLEFTPFDIERIYSSMRASSQPGQIISRLDALLGHLWRLITRARQIPSNETVYLDMSLGLRSRLTPPLPDTFLGCPLTNISPSLPTSTLLDSSSTGAATIRSAIEVTTPLLPDLLHHEAFAMDPIREWNAFMGSRHLMVTSWLGIGAEDVYFEEEARGKGWIHADMWPIDGLMVLMDRSAASGPETAEPLPSGQEQGHREIKGEESHRQSARDLPTWSTGRKQQGRWYENGVVVRLVLQPEVMGGLLDDEELWPRSRLA